MKLKTNSYAFRFFANNLFAPLFIHILAGVLLWFGLDIRILFVTLAVVFVINSINLTMSFFYTGWHRVGLLVITAFNIISVFAMGALSFFTSLFGWVHVVPELVRLLFPH